MIIVGGCTTSGCIVGDRSLATHDSNLFDIEQKYADLMVSQETIAAPSSLVRR